MGSIERNDSGATFALNATWKFQARQGNEWTYSTTGSRRRVRRGLEDRAGTRRPSRLVLTPGRCRTARSPRNPAARVLDRTGAELLTQHVVTLVNVSPGADVNAVAALLNPIAPGITADSLQTDLTAANGQPVTAITLRPDDLAPDRGAACGACRT